MTFRPDLSRLTLSLLATAALFLSGCACTQENGSAGTAAASGETSTAQPASADRMNPADVDHVVDGYLAIYEALLTADSGAVSRCSRSLHQEVENLLQGSQDARLLAVRAHSVNLSTAPALDAMS